MITWENYEEYMILLADGELSADEERELRQFVAANPKLQAELATYEDARIVPDETVVYANKEALLKPLPKKKVMALNQWWLYSAAACMLIGIFIVISNMGPVQNNTNSVALDKPINNANMQQPLPQVDTSNRSVVVAPLQRKNTALPAHPGNATHTHTAAKAYAAGKSKTNENKREKEIIIPMTTAPNSQLAVVASAPVQKIHAIPTATQAITKNVETDQTTDNRLLAMVPIIQKGKDNITDIKDAVADKVKQVQDIGKDMKDVNVVLHVGNREIAFNF